jgi:hypothetical protein
MKTYEVILVHTAYEQYTVEANTEKEAEALAWKHLEKDLGAGTGYGEWDCRSITELT